MILQLKMVDCFDLYFADILVFKADPAGRLPGDKLTDMVLYRTCVVKLKMIKHLS